MAKTLANLRTEIRIYLDESSQADFLDSEVDLAANRAYHDVIGSVMEIYENFYEVTSPYTYALVANQQEYTISSSLIKVTRVEVNYNPNVSGSVATRAVPIKENEIRGNLSNTNTIASNYIAAYYLHGNIGSQKLGLTPIPSVSDTTGQSLSVWGISMPSDLSNATDDVNIPYADRFVYLVCLKAAAQLLRKGQQEENNAQNYITEYEKGLLQMKAFLKERMSDDVNIINDAILENNDFTTLEMY